MQKKENPISKIWIVLSFVFLLPPLGILLTGLRLKQNKRELLKGGRTLLTVSLVFLGLFFLFMLIDYTGIQDFLFSLYFFGSGAVIAFVMSLTMIKKGSLQEKYRVAVEEHKLVELNEIAAAVKLPLYTVVRDLQEMITVGIFPEAAIDIEKGIFTLRVYTVENQQFRTIQCKSCGASVVVVLGRDALCEYCGSPVSFN